VEFPSGPLGIGPDIEIQPVVDTIGTARVKLLSPTDSCRDRLAAFHHWHDRQSLDAAVRIPNYHRIDLDAVGEWSSRESAASGFTEFVQALRKRRAARGTARRTRGPSKSPRKKQT